MIPLRINYSKEFSFLQSEVTNVLLDVIKNGRFILKEDLIEFEEEFASFCAAKKAVGVASGTAALHLALLAMAIQKGDEVITNAMSFNATSEAIMLCGAKPVFVDVLEDNLSIDVSKIEGAITKNTRAILIVHLYGIPADMDIITGLCEKYKLLLLEDCAQALGTLYKGKHVGVFGEVGCFSFMPSKNLGCYGEGGGVISNNEHLVEKLRRLRNHGLTQKYTHMEMGLSEKLDNLQAAILKLKLKYLRKWNERRAEIALMYNEGLDTTKLHITRIPKNCRSSYYTYVILVKNRGALIQKLKTRGIATGVFYPIPLHLQPASAHLGYKKGDLPIVEQLADEILSLPIHPFLEDGEVEYVIEQVNSNC